MPPKTARARLLALPPSHDPAGGRMDALRLEKHGRRLDLVMDFQALELTGPLRLVEHDGRVEEQVQGTHHPRRLRFTGAELERGAELGPQLAVWPPDHPDRTISGTFQWRSTEGVCRFMVVVPNSYYPILQFTARRCLAEPRAGAPGPADHVRAWSPPPAAPARLVPNPRRLRQRFGGDPISLDLNGLRQPRRLFIGGLDTQAQRRPEVDVVLNVSEAPSRWAKAHRPDPRDRWENKQEGAQGMRSAEIAAEARWVIDHLQAGRRVLVHCSAGMNRSATICCGVLILLEGLSAEAALERVRQRHLWARPDSYHWLALRWLAQTTSGATTK